MLCVNGVVDVVTVPAWMLSVNGWGVAACARRAF